ncbi:MAG: hypothetical protein JJU45_18445 [Acidimicrobiia bacterium]|nr:hypothetical protein [Acidimicrobiia bacterium]
MAAPAGASQPSGFRSVHIAFVTSERPQVLADDVDRPLHEAAAARRGWHLEHTSWWDPTVDWAAFDLVVVRSVWDYVEQTAAFRSWLEALPSEVHLHNPRPLVQWNMDKRYLGDLSAAGADVVPTAVATDETTLAGALDAATEPPWTLGGGERSQVVVKPTVSAGSRRTGRFDAGDERATALGREILAAGGQVLVQPAVPSVATEGEVAVVCFAGEVSHVVRKGPMLASGGGLLGGAYHERLTKLSSDDPAARTAVHAAQQAMAAVDAVAGKRWPTEVALPLLYARYDVVTLPDGAVVVLEAELFEPAFYLPVVPAAAERFADALATVTAKRTATSPTSGDLEELRRLG